MKAIGNLKKYVKEEEELVDCDLEELSCFDKFCLDHLSDIEECTNCIEEIKGYIDSLDINDFEEDKDYYMVRSHLEKIKEIIQKVLD